MQKYKNILITGANSFLGTNVVRELASRGVKMRGILRHTNSLIENTAEFEIVHGSLMDHADLSRAAQGCDCIVHIASITDQSLPRYEQYRAFNVASIELVVRVAREQNISRVVYVSSANAIGNGTPTDPADERTPPAAPFSTMHYGRSKVEAEARLRELAAQDLDYTILNPAFMLGPYDWKPSSGQIIKMGYDKRVIFCTPGGKSIVSVRAAAVALCNAIEHGARGENYLLAGENIALTDFFRIVNPRATIITVPRFALIASGVIGSFLRWFGIPTQLSYDNLRVVCAKEYYTGAKARTQLSMPDVPVNEAIREEIEWLQAHGKLKN